jgi:hypothetical protein
MRDAELEEAFPKLRNGQYEITSPFEPGYNCIAHALYDSRQFWQFMRGRTKGYYWALDWNNSVAAWMEIFRLHGYTPCSNGDLEADMEKVAIYVQPSGLPSHVARQLESGKWTSKLGKDYDITHDSLDLLEGSEGDEYGSVEVFMQRAH